MTESWHADERLPVIARFEVRHRAYLAPDGSIHRRLPAFASDTRLLVRLYWAMVLVRATSDRLLPRLNRLFCGITGRCLDDGVTDLSHWRISHAHSQKSLRKPVLAWNFRKIPCSCIGDRFVSDCAHHHPVSANHTFPGRRQIAGFCGDFRPLTSRIWSLWVFTHFSDDFGARVSASKNSVPGGRA